MLVTALGLLLYPAAAATAAAFFVDGVAVSVLFFLYAFFVQDDTPELLASDVHIAGAGICDDSAVMKLARQGPKRVEEMLLSGTAEVSDLNILENQTKKVVWRLVKLKVCLDR